MVMDIKVNQVSQVVQPEAAAPVREADGNFKFTLVSHVEEQELQARLTTLMEEITMQGEKLAKKLKLNLKEIDMFEINEAFASQAYAVRRDLELDKDKVNIYGGGISIGHPIGATGAILTVKVLYELMRTEKKDAMISMCIGGGQGISMYFTKCRN